MAIKVIINENRSFSYSSCAVSHVAWGEMALHSKSCEMHLQKLVITMQRHFTPGTMWQKSGTILTTLTSGVVHKQRVTLGSIGLFNYFMACLSEPRSQMGSKIRIN